MASTAGIPQRFKLQIGSESSRLCSVANVKGNNVRVEFAQPSNV
ncbi:MAG: hypothetical protein ABW198_07280 [Pseudorhodoplanes sp.]